MINLFKDIQSSGQIFNFIHNLETKVNFKPKILCIIPARSGSKGIEHKNIKIFNGKPLLSWSIEQAKKSRYNEFMKIFVSTDSIEYSELAKKWGAEVPILRPDKISNDNSTDYEFITHTLNWLKDNQNYIPDFVIQLRPTQPLRKINDIDNAIKIFLEVRNQYDSLRSVIEYNKSPYKMYNIVNNKLNPLFDKIGSITEPINQCRQILPKVYLHNGYIDIFNTDIVNYGTISGKNIYPYVMSEHDTIDIDTYEDWIKAEKATIND